MISVAEIM